MNGFNVNVALCESYDESTMSANRFFNEVEMKGDTVEVCIFSMFNYIGREDVSIDLDYYIKCILPEDNKYKDTKIPLFSVGVNGKRVSDVQDYKVFESITTQRKEVNFPTKGMYEVQVYEIGKDAKGIKKSTERYRKYRENNINPISAYRFFVK